MSVGPRQARVGGGFATRHRVLLVLLWAQIPVLAANALVRSEPTTEVALTSMTLMLVAVAGTVIRTPSLSASTVSLGLVATSAVVMLYAGGNTLSLFHLVMTICAVSFYREWPALTVAVLASSTWLVTSALAGGDPVTSALLESAAVVALALLLVLGWRLAAESDSGSDIPMDLFRISFQAAPIGIAVLRPSGEFVEVNPAMTHILGYGKASLIGANITGLVHPDDKGDLGEAWEQMGNSTAHTAIEWLRCLTASGQPIWARVSLSLVPRTEDHSAMVVLQLEDVTQTYEEQRRLQALLRGKDQFVAAVGDEIRTPLSLLIDLTDAAEHAHVDIRETLPRIEAHAKEMAYVLDDLVVSARADTAPVSVVSHMLDVEKLCRDVVARTPGTEQIGLHFTATDLWGDPVLTSQIVTNLVVNAVRYGGPEVSLRTIDSGPDTVIQVFDNGPEIPLEERERIFSGDLRTGQPVTRPATVGLRLTVGRHLARMMEGDLVYRRTATGENLFELRLPSEQISELPRRRASMKGLGIPV